MNEGAVLTETLSDHEPTLVEGTYIDAHQRSSSTGGFLAVAVSSDGQRLVIFERTADGYVERRSMRLEQAIAGSIAVSDDGRTVYATHFEVPPSSRVSVVIAIDTVEGVVKPVDLDGSSWAPGYLWHLGHQ